MAVLSIAVIYILIVYASATDPEVSVPGLGTIVGKTVDVPYDGLRYTVHQYLGIPFAEPPEGDRRFTKPEGITKLDSPFYAHTHGPICPQLGRADQNENCLMLNVFVPDHSTDKLAVIVWIHGGSFVRGSADIYNGSTLALYGNIIVVTMNYRLGVLGFLSTGDDNAPENLGLWDQRLAILWVKNNIGAFGGDDQRITISGVSAGGMAAIQHGLRAENRGLFQRVIAHSGSLSAPVFDFERDPMDGTTLISDSVGCTNDSNADLITCLRGKSVIDLLQAVIATNTVGSFYPMVDGDMVKTNPQNTDQLSPGDAEFFRSVDLLSGFNVYDGSVLLSYVIDPSLVEILRPTSSEMKSQYMPLTVSAIYRKIFKPELLDLIFTQYTDWDNPNDYKSNLLQLTRLIGDTNFAVPVVQMARLHGNTKGNFMYYFTPAPAIRLSAIPSWIDASAHAEEVPFLFGAIGTLIGIGDENAWEIELSSRMMRYWSNFVKSGDPNSPEEVTPTWPEYGTDTEGYLTLEKSMSNGSIGQHLYAGEANFWLEVIPSLDSVLEAGDNQNNCDDDGETSGVAGISFHKFHTFLFAISLAKLSFLISFSQMSFS